MRIGIFDSGLGGLAVAQAIVKRLPQFDYIYLGDTKRVPYGNRSQETIHEFTSQALDYLFRNECQLVILGCNTASAEALRRSQQEYLPVRYPDRRVLGVLIPCAEAALDDPTVHCVGVIATASAVESGSYEREIARIRPGTAVKSVATPMLVPIVENGAIQYVQPILRDYLAEFDGFGIQRLILGCTHYCLLKDELRGLWDVPSVSADDVVPDKLASYLERHPEIESLLSRTATRRFCVTDLTPGYADVVERFVGQKLPLEIVCL